jgi:Zn-dependent M28 family amino/carboxypeptidase
MKSLRPIPLLLLAATALGTSWQAALTKDQEAALELVSARSLEGHVSFLASDLLEGRGTPSKGLDIAAEYIAAQFRRAGIEPAIGKSYFQTVPIRGRNGAPDATAHNVVGILRGSDPVLKETYVLVSAHYDHVGMNPNLEGDQIFNGANDDASGTAAVIELASTLGTLKKRPKRTLVFVAFCGEERGLVGSTFYSQNPIFPLKNTVAAINLEHIGRTDDTEGKRENEASMTGFDYSDLGPIIDAAGRAFGIRVTKHPRNSDSFFARSDNLALARVGIPSHTLCTAFLFPDYHMVGDHWEKLDYANMQKVVKTVGAGLLFLAESEAEPKWNTSNPRTERYVEAWKTLKGG